MVSPRQVVATFKKTFTEDILTIPFDPCLSTIQIYQDIFPIITQHFPDLEFGEIEIVVAGQVVPQYGQPENGHPLPLNDNCFKNTPHWEGYDAHYSFYTRPKIQAEGDECAICYNPISDLHRPFVCHHGFCQGCISRWIEQNDNPTCPTCRAPLSVHYHPEPPPPANDFNYMEGIVEILENVINNNNYINQPNYNHYINNHPPINNFINENINNQMDNNPPPINNFINIAT